MTAELGFEGCDEEEFVRKSRGVHSARSGVLRSGTRHFGPDNSVFCCGALSCALYRMVSSIPVPYPLDGRAPHPPLMTKPLSSRVSSPCNSSELDHRRFKHRGLFPCHPTFTAGPSTSAFKKLRPYSGFSTPLSGPISHQSLE